ncbi:phosphatase PAP2 family protein [bacterium]|nr:phosphatase PAP2 family protein [bacterium]
MRAIVFFLPILFLQTTIVLSDDQKTNNLAKNILRDQKVIWSSPFVGSNDRFKWIIPIAATSAFLLGQDNEWSQNYTPSENTLNWSDSVSKLGSAYGVYGTVSAFYLLGKLGHNENLSHTGLVGLETLLNSTIVTGALKLATSRERPNTGDGDGSFWGGGSSFPSGHSMSIWSIATAMVNARPRPIYWHIIAYSIASSVSVARIAEEKHYASDVFVGSAIGFFIGRYVAHQSSARQKFVFIPVADHKSVGFNLICKW